jgi:hypothetical protein
MDRLVFVGCGDDEAEHDPDPGDQPDSKVPDPSKTNYAAFTGTVRPIGDALTRAPRYR